MASKENRKPFKDIFLYILTNIYVQFAFGQMFAAWATFGQTEQSHRVPGRKHREERESPTRLA